MDLEENPPPSEKSYALSLLAGLTGVVTTVRTRKVRFAIISSVAAGGFGLAGYAIDQGKIFEGHIASAGTLHYLPL